jgi:hypothetical protein
MLRTGEVSLSLPSAADALAALEVITVNECTQLAADWF